MSAHHPIAIIGAGLGGLMLARVLHVNGVTCAVFDLDASPTARSQGGMLDLHVDSGQAALRAAGLYDEFRGLVFQGGEATRILDKHGVVRFAEEDHGDGSGEHDRPEVNRRDLRDLLLGSLPEGTIRWGAKVVEARALGDGRHEVMLADGNKFTTELLVGADGAWSRVRSLVSDAKPSYCGLSFVELSLEGADKRHPAAAGLVGQGMMFALSDSKGFLGHRDPDGSLHVYAALLADESWSTSGEIDFADTEKAKVALAEYFSDWHEDFLDLIIGADGALVPRPIHALPIDHQWDRVPGVTLVGDAAHLMSPFAGEGANLALQDGAELAAALATNPGRPEAALSQYEAALFPRSQAAAAQSADGLLLCFNPESPQALLDFFNSIPR
ncbi:FAD-dependent oxidoreductase [Kribbella monticola]|uniref:FAD-dependent oxidoreductase n=1 Tax=Kribbella monticola TaxID=2185285 RepID=UPI000DD4360F|nr:NAD(P)/FAD-dependent oxidoreductase [Kribbella monticola]